MDSFIAIYFTTTYLSVIGQHGVRIKVIRVWESMGTNDNGHYLIRSHRANSWNACKSFYVDAIKRYKDFVARCFEALNEWKKGNRDIAFPPGTYAMRVQLGVKVSPG